MSQFKFKDRVMKKNFPVSEVKQSIGTVVSKPAEAKMTIVQWDITNEAEIVDENTIMPIPFRE